MTLDFIIIHFAWLGSWFFFLGATAEALPIIGTVLPGATTVTLGGFASAHGYFSVGSVIIFSITGAIIGDAISYYLGSHGGNYLRRKKLISETIIQKGEDFFRKYGNQSLLWGRFIGPIRSIIPFLAGLTKVKAKTFWVWNILSGIAWGIFYVLLGYFSGNLVAVIIKRWRYRLTWIILPIIAIVLLAWVVKHHGQSIKQYFKNISAKFANNLEQYRFIKKIEARYPALHELFILPAAQVKLYFSVIAFIILIILTCLTFIFDWI